MGRAVSCSRKHNVRWHAASANAAQGGGDRRIISRPVGAQQDVMLAKELLLDLFIVEHHPLIHLTGKTPCRGEIDKDGFPLVSRCSERGIGERLPLKPIG